MPHVQNAPQNLKFYYVQVKIIGTLGNEVKKKKTKNFALASLPYPVFVCFSEDLVPVTNRRCLCELAKQIGFTDSVTNAYNVQECLAVFRHLVSLQIYFFRSYLFDCLLM